MLEPPAASRPHSSWASSEAPLTPRSGRAVRFARSRNIARCRLVIELRTCPRVSCCDTDKCFANSAFVRALGDPPGRFRASAGARLASARPRAPIALTDPSAHRRRMRCTRRSSSTASSRPPRAAHDASPSSSSGSSRRRTSSPAIASTRSAPAPGRELTTRSSSRPAEEQPDAVVERPAAGDRAVANGGEPDRQALGLAVGVHAERALEQAEARRASRAARSSGSRPA